MTYKRRSACEIEMRCDRAYVVVDVVSRQQLSKVQSVGLFQELDLTRMSRRISKGDQHHSRNLKKQFVSTAQESRTIETDVDDLSIDIEHSRL